MKYNVTKVVTEILSKGFHINPEVTQLLSEFNNEEELKNSLNKIIEKKLKLSDNNKIILKDDIIEYIPKNVEINKNELDIELKTEYEIIFDPTDEIEKKNKLNFYTLFQSRYKKLLKLSSNRPGINIENIENVNTNNNSKHYVSGLIMDKSVKPKSVYFTIDDLTGTIPLVALNDNTRMIANEVISDQFVIAKIQPGSKGSFIAEELYHPDIPDRSSNFSDKKVYAMLLSDLHLGSKTFLTDAISRIINWLNNSKNDYVASRIRYIIIAGDGIDGIGVYPGQENDLDILSVNEQYLQLANFLKQIPNNIEIFLGPGNHDAVRQALPQPKIAKKFANSLYEIDNVNMIGNPCLIEIHGVKILVYHGRSLDDIIATIPGLSVSRPALAMKALLKVRHLAPIYGRRTKLSPENEDFLTIDTVPDIFHAGHLHVLDSERYRGTLLINSGTLQSQTDFQSKMGIVPNPGIVPIVDLSTLELLSKDFKEEN